ncbi:YegS/Rv2252/BmrU family lipid kinase [Kamptonema cortianum]|nr:YegS/Rv2252/BmrU family lipid kinase [Geitlerinema splendidum]MDK3162481.1 YegS/Rv2252/BmrU family lipid kinase [Kamptonema cortianum]
MGEIFFYANVNARRGSSAFDESLAALTTAGVALSGAEAFEEHPQFVEAVSQAIKGGAECVIVGGGDGTISSVAHLFVDQTTVLAVMPLGTGNQLARELMIPSNLVEAAQIVKSRRTVQIDVALVNDQAFLTVATIGLTSVVARNLVAKGTFGKLAYGPGVLKALKQAESFQVTLESEARTIEAESIQVVVSNGRTHAGPFWASPDATVTDGLLDVYLLAPQGGFHLAKAGLLALVGQHVEMESVTFVRSGGFKLLTQPKKPIVVDGEEMWFDEMEFSICPGAIRVVVGEGFRYPEDRLVVEGD